MNVSIIIIITNNFILSIRSQFKTFQGETYRNEKHEIRRKRKIENILEEKVNLPTNQRLLILAPQHYPGFRGLHLLDPDVGRVDRNHDQLRWVCHCKKFLVGALEKFRRGRYRYRLARDRQREIYSSYANIWAWKIERTAERIPQKYLSRFSHRPSAVYSRGISTYPVLFIAILSKIFF